MSGVALSYAVHPLAPPIPGHDHRVHALFKWLLAANIFAFFRNALPTSSSVLAGAHAVGVLSLSLEIANLPGSELIAPINRAAFPRYASLAHDRNALHREFLSVLSLITLVLTPVVTGIALVSPLVVALLLGPKWAEAAMIMKFAAFLGLTYIFLGTSHPLLLAIGKPGVFAKIYALQVAVMVPPMIFFTVRSGVEGAALAYAVTALALLPVNVTLVTRTAELPDLQPAARRLATVHCDYRHVPRHMARDAHDRCRDLGGWNRRVAPREIRLAWRCALHRDGRRAVAPVGPTRGARVVCLPAPRHRVVADRGEAGSNPLLTRERGKGDLISGGVRADSNPA